jgi:hypothetical protein
VGNAVKAPAQVRVDDLDAPTQEGGLDRFHRLMRPSLGAIGVAVWMTVGFQDRQEQQAHRRLDHSIFHRRYAQGTLLAIAFG